MNRQRVRDWQERQVAHNAFLRYLGDWAYMARTAVPDSEWQRAINEAVLDGEFAAAQYGRHLWQLARVRRLSGGDK